MAVTQTLLFDTPIARNSDPPTSHKAARELECKFGTLRAMALRRAEHLYGEYGDVTANEIAAAGTDNGRIDESIRKRVTELRRRGFLVIVGERKCRITGKTCQAYRVVEHRNSSEAP